MKKNIVMMAFCLLGVLLFAQERVAILPFTGGEGREGDTLAQMFGTELTKLGYFQIVPRTAAIDKVVAEHNFQRGGLTDGDTIVELGRGANAKYVVSGHIQSLDNRKMISASIVDVETFQQVAGDYYEYDDLSEVIDYLPELAQKLINGTKKSYSKLPTLAILPFDSEDENDSDVLAQLLAIELANSGKYVVVSRTTTVENVMKEQNIQRSGITDSDSISKLGIAMNADYVLSGSAYNLGSSGFMNVQIIDVETLVQVKGAYVEYKTIEDGARLMSVLSFELTGVGEKEAKAALVEQENVVEQAKIVEKEEIIKIEAPLSNTAMLKNIESFKIAQWAGRYAWIFGGAYSIVSIGVLGGNSKEPMPNDYSNYAEYKDAYEDWLSFNNELWITSAIISGVVFVAGGLVDIIFTSKIKGLEEKLEARGISVSVAPVIKPDFASSSMNYGMQVSVKYSF